METLDLNKSFSFPLFQVDQNYVTLKDEINTTKILLHEEDNKLSRAVTEVNDTMNTKVRYLRIL